MSSDQAEFFDARSQLGQDRSNIDQPYSGANDEVLSTGEGPEVFQSARSHISNSSDASAWETTDEVTSNAGASPNSSPDIGLDVGEVTRVLSEEENQRLIDKIDRLIAVVTEGRQVHFDPNSVTGEVNVSAAYLDQRFDGEDGELEANIANFPENFENLIPPGYRIRRTRGLTSGISIESITSSGIQSQDSNAWERAIAEADKRYEREQGVLIQEGVSIRKALRMQKENAGEQRGHRLARVGPAGVEVLSVWPVPLDFKKVRPPRTQSVRSEESEPSCSSPLWMKSCLQMIQDTDTKARTEANLHKQIASWLDRTEMPPGVQLPRAHKGKRIAFGVFRDDQDGEVTNTGAPKAAYVYKVLKDVSNLRRPGYLEYNSFAEGKGPANQPAAFKLPSQAFGGASGQQARRSYINMKRPGLLQAGKVKSAEAVQGLKAPATIGLSSPTQDPASENAVPALAQPVEQDLERAAHFEYALARLEGRAAPAPTSPIRRYAHEDGVYGSDVEVDLHPLRARQPWALRYMEGTLAQKFERLLGVDVDRGIDPHAHLGE